jgi:hypothetical protein
MPKLDGSARHADGTASSRLCNSRGVVISERIGNPAALPNLIVSGDS